MRKSTPRYDEPLTAELADEGDPDGAVVIRDRHGTEVMCMPRKTYDALRARKE
jgi:hypothetical protein